MQPAGFTSARVAVVANLNAAWGGLDSKNGEHYVGLHGAGAYVEQIVRGLTPGDVYTISFVAATRPVGLDESLQAHELALRIDDVESWRSSSLSTTTFQNFSTRFTARRSSSIIRFENASPDPHNDVLLDAVHVVLCRECPSSQAFGSEDFVERCSAASDLYITFLDDIEDRSWAASTDPVQFRVQLCIRAAATISFQGNALVVDVQHGADGCPREFQNKVLVDDNELDIAAVGNSPTYHFPSGHFRVPERCDRIDVEKYVAAGPDVVNIVAPSDSNDWTGLMEISAPVDRASVYDITVLVACGRIARDITAHGRPSLRPNGMTFDGTRDYVTVATWDYAQDATFSIARKLVSCVLGFLNLTNSIVAELCSSSVDEKG